MITNDNFLIISPNYLKKTSTFLNDIDDQYIEAGIKEAQRFWLMNLLGSKLYEEIKFQITGSTVSTENQTLIDNHIVPVISYYGMYESITYIRTKITNKGIVNQTSEHSETIEYNEYNDLRKDFKNKAEFEVQRMLMFLCDRSSDYPLYNTIDTDGDLAPTKKNYRTGFIF